jgi:tripartite-type tricarboxylate transporter receptor subunit TctC
MRWSSAPADGKEEKVVKILRNLHRVCALLLLLAVGASAMAQAASYPVKPVRWIVPFPPGGGADTVARLVGQKLSESLGQPFVLDNRPGAGGAVAAELVARAAPDGYTLLLANPGPSINNPLLRKNIGYRIADFEPVAFLAYTPLILYAHPAFAPANAKALADYARAHPGQINWGSSGNGSSLHIGLALFQAATGTEITHVPYKGAAPALADVIGGRIQVMYTTLTTGIGHVKAGRVRILANAGTQRIAALPDVPTLAEQGIHGAEATTWFGMVAPAMAPRALIERLNREVNEVLEMADVRKRLDQLGLGVGGGAPEEFGAFISAEAEKLAKLVKTGLVRPE